MFPRSCSRFDGSEHAQAAPLLLQVSCGATTSRRTIVPCLREGQSALRQATGGLFAMQKQSDPSRIRGEQRGSGLSSIDSTAKSRPQNGESSTQGTLVAGPGRSNSGGAAFLSGEILDDSLFPFETAAMLDSQSAPADSISIFGSIPLSPTSFPRSLVARSSEGHNVPKLSGLMLHVLKCYPATMLQQSLPPYIHPHTASASFKHADLEHLHNCMSLVYMTSSRAPGARKLFWDNVRRECERMCGEVGD
ncbi:hypothetical protein ANO11243_094500 [Dothideomycetidae sp. 11243]|nr:hypothetical protein ANO11243_094500 [fungal sp. No.11243]